MSALSAGVDSTWLQSACLPLRYVPAPALLRILFSRIWTEFQVEWPLLRTRWKTITACLALQYVHGIFTQLVYRFHVPASKPLPDAGFAITPELGPKQFWISEMLFGALFGSFILWILSPFFLERKSFYTVVVAQRLLLHLVCCQALRVISFSSTLLPGPAHHCREGEWSARREWVHHWWHHLTLDLRRQAMYSCGDLIFSSHMTFILAFVICYTYHGRVWAAKAVAWALAAALAVLIVASRKHYTVDVVVAWYVVPLVFLAMERRFVTRRHDAESVRWMELSDVVISPTGSLERGTHEASPSAEAAEAASSCHASATSRQTQYQPGTMSPKGLRASAHHSRRPTGDSTNSGVAWDQNTAAGGREGATPAARMTKAFSKSKLAPYHS